MQVVQFKICSWFPHLHLDRDYALRLMHYTLCIMCYAFTNLPPYCFLSAFTPFLAFIVGVYLYYNIFHIMSINIFYSSNFFEKIKSCSI